MEQSRGSRGDSGTINVWGVREYEIEIRANQEMSFHPPRWRMRRGISRQSLHLKAMEVPLHQPKFFWTMKERCIGVHRNQGKWWLWNCRDKKQQRKGKSNFQFPCIGKREVFAIDHLDNILRRREGEWICNIHCGRIPDLSWNNKVNSWNGIVRACHIWTVHENEHVLQEHTCLQQS